MAKDQWYSPLIICTKFVATLTNGFSPTEDEVSACVVEIVGQKVILLDTPGPDHRDDKEEAFDAITIWLSKKAR